MMRDGELDVDVNAEDMQKWRKPLLFISAAGEVTHTGDAYSEDAFFTS